jgi:hypothetical protein
MFMGLTQDAQEGVVLQISSGPLVDCARIGAAENTMMKYSNRSGMTARAVKMKQKRAPLRVLVRSSCGISFVRFMLQRSQHFLAVEHLYVLGLRRRYPPHRPNQLDIIRLMRRMHGMHSHFFEQMTALAVVTRRAGRHHILPGVVTTSRKRNDVITREKLAAAQLRLVSPAILTFVAIPREQERVRYLTTEFAGDMDEANEANDSGSSEGVTLGMKHSRFVDLEHFRFSVDNKPQRAP